MFPSAGSWPLPKPLQRRSLSLLLGAVILLVVAFLTGGLQSWLPGTVTSAVQASLSVALPAQPGPLPQVDDGRSLQAPPEATASVSRRQETLARHTSAGVASLTTAFATLAFVAAVLCITQRSRQDGVLALSALTWTLYSQLSSRAMPGPPSWPTPSLWMSQLVMLMGVGTLFWFAIRMAGWRPSEGQRVSLWPVWAVGVGLACILGWSRGIDGDTGSLLVPIACLGAGGYLLVHVLPALRRTLVLPLAAPGFFMLIAIGALGFGSGLLEIWLEVAHPGAIEIRTAVWFLTRWIIVAHLLIMLCWRFVQVARLQRKVASGHRRIRNLLRGSEAEAQDLQRGLGLRDLWAQQVAQRDQIARDALDDVVRDLTALDARWASPVGNQHGADRPPSPSLDNALHTLMLVRDSLDTAPKPLDEAFEQLKPRLAQSVADVAGQLEWQIDSRTRALVLPAGETLMWERLACEAVALACDLGWAQNAVRLRLEVSDVETGLHLRLKLTPCADGVPFPGARVDRDLFGSPLLPAALESRQRLQRFATALSAQMVLETRPGQTAAIDIVKPLRDR